MIIRPLPSASASPGSPISKDDRAWFLRDSGWDDVVWRLAPTNVLEEERPRTIYWDFPLPSGRRFTDPPYRSLLKASKQFLTLFRSRSLHFGHSQRAETVFHCFVRLRWLIRWMDTEGFSRFADLDSAALLRSRRAVTDRKSRSGAPVTSTTLLHHLSLLDYMYRFRAELDDALSVDPCPGQSPFELAGMRKSPIRHTPYAPDAVAVPLIEGALAWLENGAIDVLRAREMYATTVAQYSHRSRHLYINAVRAMQHITLRTPRGPQTIRSVDDFDELVQMLYTACFVAISYLVGLRISEILHLQAGCLQWRPIQDGGCQSGVVVIVGTIFKQEPDYYGRPHEWVAPPPAAHAVSVLEALSSPHRLRTGRKDLWLRPRGRSRHRAASEWRRDLTDPCDIASTDTITRLLNHFASWLKVPAYEGKPWHFATHQGRKTFAHFAALRDTTSLLALAQHFGHRERSITDRGYTGIDYALDREIDAQILEQSVAAWEHMLSAPQLGGRAGAEILAKRPHFRGVRMKEDLKAYARMLVEAGLLLGVCDYGYCVYRQEYSACLGNAAGPNPVRREPSTCARCKNFVVSAQHRTYWLEQAHRCEALLGEPAPPTQTLKILRARLEVARTLVRRIDSLEMEESHGSKTSH